MTLLVYPRVKPLGAESSTTTNQGIRSKQRFPTEVIDYLKLEIIESKKGGNSKSGNSGGKVLDTIYLYLPEGMKESYNGKYQGLNLGAIGKAGVDIAANLAGGSGVENIGTSLSEAAKAAKPQAMYKLGSKAINELAGNVGAYNPNLDANSLAQLTQGRIFNPYEETVFQGTDYVNHSFNFNLIPKSSEDVQMIYDIINKLRLAMHPGKDKENWLTIPDRFRASIVRYKSKGDVEEISGGKAFQKNNRSTGGYMSSLFRFPHLMVMSNLTFNTGSSEALKSYFDKNDVDFGFAFYTLSLSFQETKFRTKEDFKDA